MLTVNGSILREGSVMYGAYSYNHVNLGQTSTTGTSGQDYSSATVSGDDDNVASGGYSTVSGGVTNTASGLQSTVSGGRYNKAGGSLSWAGGRNMQLSSSACNTFVWGYSTTAQTINTGNAFLIFPVGTSGKVGIGTTEPGAKLEVSGNFLLGADGDSFESIKYLSGTTHSTDL